MSVYQRTAATLGIVLLVCATGISRTANAQRIMIPGVGPINRAMGSASVAAPLDAIGAMPGSPFPGNVVPNSSVSTELGVYAIGFGTTVRY